MAYVPPDPDAVALRALVEGSVDRAFTRDAWIARLVSMRALIDSMLASAEAIPIDPPACPHLETENIGTFGVPEYRCTMCKASVPAPAG